jgi:hypothetical protein
MLQCFEISKMLDKEVWKEANSSAKDQPLVQ